MHIDFFFLILFIYLFMAVLGLRFCARAFSSCSKRGPLFIAVHGPLLLRSTGSRRAGLAIVAHGPSRSAACGTLPDQGSNPCPLHWQADSQPLHHQGSPCTQILNASFVMKRCAQNKRNANSNTPRQDFSPIRLAKLLKFAITVLVKLWRNKFCHTVLMGG